MGKRRFKSGERSFIRNVAIFMGGRSAASAITFLATPIISRLYFPNHFGMAAFLLGIASVVGAMSCGSYEKAINVARSTSDARRLFDLCIRLTATTAALTAVVLSVLWVTGMTPSKLSALGPLMWVLPVVVVMHGIELAAGGWLLRHNQYKALASAEVLQTGVRSGTRLLAGFGLGSTAFALLGSVVVSGLSKLWMMRAIVRRFAPLTASTAERSEPVSLRSIARSYSDFPRYNMITGFMMQLTNQLPVFVLGSAFGAEVVGFFAMADRVMRAPVNITSNALRMVVVQRLSEIWNSGRPIRAQLTKVVAGLLLLGVVPVLIFWTRGEELLTFVLGDRWAATGRYIEIMVPYFAVIFMGAPFQASTVTMRRQRVWFWLEMVTATARLAIIPVAAMDGATPETVLRVYVWTTFTTKLFAFVFTYLQVPRKHPGLNSA